jgi:hypothetical protein
MEEPGPCVPGEDKGWRSQSVSAESPLPCRVSASSGSRPDRHALLNPQHMSQDKPEEGPTLRERLISEGVAAPCIHPPG